MKPMLKAMLAGLACLASTVSSAEYPLDSVLRVNHIQMKASHNSYHVANAIAIVTEPLVRYTHLPLYQQLEHGARGLEFDVWYKRDLPLYNYHHPNDAGTHCTTFVECHQQVKAWSDANREHHPLFLMVEVKGVEGVTLNEVLSKIDTEFLSVWGDRAVTYDMITRNGTYKTLREAVRTAGWPTLAETRGKVFCMIQIPKEEEAIRLGEYGAAIMNQSAVLQMSQYHLAQDQPWAIVQNLEYDLMWTPRYLQNITALINDNVFFRARADADTKEAIANNATLRDTIIAMGIHFIHSDFVHPSHYTPYWVNLPGGTPSRCNPINAPAGCTAQHIEILHSDSLNAATEPVSYDDGFWCCGGEPFFWTAMGVLTVLLPLAGALHFMQLRAWGAICCMCLPRPKDTEQSGPRRTVLAIYGLFVVYHVANWLTVMTQRVVSDVILKRHVLTSDDLLPALLDLVRSAVSMCIIGLFTHLLARGMDATWSLRKWALVLQYPLMAVLTGTVAVAVAGASGKKQLLGMAEFDVARAYLYLQLFLLLSSLVAITHLCLSLKTTNGPSTKRTLSLIFFIAVQTPQLFIIALSSFGLTAPGHSLVPEGMRVLAWHCLLVGIEVFGLCVYLMIAALSPSSFSGVSFDAKSESGYELTSKAYGKVGH